MRKRLTHGLLFTILAAVASGCGYLRANYRPVEPNQFYRSGQMHPEAFERKAENDGIQTVILLRGESPGERWYDDETAIAAALGLEFHSLGWSKNRLPTPEEMQRFIRLVDESPPPVLVHCHGGVHRASAASAIYVLLEGGTVEDARAELARGFRDAPIGDFLDWYDGSEKPFRAWVAEDYPARYAAYSVAAR
jgi:protein tyrosine phosphatase (PTP) superfamily phosphohydrolase (DUF442 family)